MRAYVLPRGGFTYDQHGLLVVVGSSYPRALKVEISTVPARTQVRDALNRRGGTTEE